MCAFFSLCSFRVPVFFYVWNVFGVSLLFHLCVMINLSTLHFLFTHSIM